MNLPPTQESGRPGGLGPLANITPEMFAKPVLRRENGALVIEPVVVGLTSGLNMKSARALVAECRRYPAEVYLDRLTAPGPGEALEVFQRYKGLLQEQGVPDAQRARQFLQGFRANGKHLIAVTMLAARWGVALRLTVQGIDAQAQSTVWRLCSGITTAGSLPDFTRFEFPAPPR